MKIHACGEVADHATQAYDEEVGRSFGLNAAGRRCLSLLGSSGPQMATLVARETSLTPAAVTALIDRLEKRRFVRRRADPADRRKVLVEADEMTFKMACAAYDAIGQAAARFLETFSQEELKTIARFVAGALEIQRRFLADVARGEGAKRPDAPRRTRKRPS
jgi:DNA-binding MarR family transcriptional regulator